MTAVVDASVLVAALVDPTRDGLWARARLREGTLAAPEFALVEAVNVFRRLDLSGRVPPKQGAAAVRDLLRVRLELYPLAPFVARVWELRETLTSYDATYVALAEALTWPLVTLDRRLSRASGPRCEMIVPSADA